MVLKGSSNGIGHCVTMFQDLRQLQLAEQHCDFVVQVEEHKYHVHKAIMTAGSEYFRAMFRHDTKENREGVVIMKDVDYQCVKIAIDYIYSGRFEVPDEKIADFINVVNIMQLHHAKTFIVRGLRDALTVDNYYSTKELAELFSLRNVVSECEKFYRKNLLHISAQPKFEMESLARLISSFKYRSAKLSEEDRLMIAIRWVKENPSEEENIFNYIRMIKFQDVSIDFHDEFIKNNPMFHSDPRIRKIVKARFHSKRKSAWTTKSVMLFDNDGDCVRSFDPVTNEVTKFRDDKFVHAGSFTAICLGSCIYILCKDRSVYLLNLKDKSSRWQRKRSMVCLHGRKPLAVVMSGLIFVIGCEGQMVQPVERFHPEFDLWIRLTDQPPSIPAVTATSCADSIYCLGRRSPHQRDMALPIFYRFTPSVSEWSALQPIAIGRRDEVTMSVASGEKIFAVVSKHRFDIYEIHCYNTVFVQWTVLSPGQKMNTLQYAHHIDGQIYLIGKSRRRNRCKKYDIALDEWHNVDIKGMGQVLISATAIYEP